MCVVKLAQGGFVESPEDNSPASEEDGLDGEWQMGSSVGFPPGSTELSSEQSCDSPDEVRGGSGLVDHEGYRLELNDDLWLIIFSTLDIRDRVALEGGVKGRVGKGGGGEWGREEGESGEGREGVCGGEDEVSSHQRVHVLGQLDCEIVTEAVSYGAP